MKNCYNDIDYYNIVYDIINNNEFKKIDECVHHGVSRFDHSCRVSYYSYKLSKIFHLNYNSVARAGLLHDFFLNDNLTKKDKMKSMFSHSKLSLKNSLELFDLNDLEKDIIYTHMFPLNLNRIPKYMESWLVSVIDKFVASYEFIFVFKTKCVLRYQNALLIMLIVFGKDL